MNEQLLVSERFENDPARRLHFTREHRREQPWSRVAARRALLAVALLAGLAEPSFGAVVVSDFEPGGTYYGGIEGWQGWGIPGMATITDPAGGTGTWVGGQPQQYYSDLVAQSWAFPDISNSVLAANTRLEFDLIVDTNWLPSSSTISLNLKVGATNNVLPGVVVDTSQKDTIQHVVFDYSSLTASIAAGTSWEFILSMNPGYNWGWDTNNPNVVAYAPQVYFDNFQLATVPEPASAATVMLSGLLLGRRRRFS